MKQPTFTIVMHAGDQLLTVPEEHFTPTQQAAIRFILSRIGQDPVPPTEQKQKDELVLVGTPVPSGMNSESRQVAQRAISKQQGYTGDACDRCQMFTLKASGHCFVCDSCGETTGCS